LRENAGRWDSAGDQTTVFPLNARPARGLIVTSAPERRALLEEQ
jgi:hypothetical protein